MKIIIKVNEKFYKENKKAISDWLTNVVTTFPKKGSLYINGILVSRARIKKVEELKNE